MPTECPVCQNVNPEGSVQCLRCNVKLEFVGMAPDPVPEPDVVNPREDVVPDSRPGCPHCGFEGNTDAAIRCFSCKNVLSYSQLFDDPSFLVETEPSTTATVCGYLVMIIGGILAATYVLSPVLRPGSGISVIGVGIALLIARAGLRVLQGATNSGTGLYVALAVLGLVAGLAVVTGLRTGTTIVTTLGGGILTLIGLTAIAFAIDQARVRRQ